MVELVARENALQQTLAKLWPVDEQGQTTIAFRAIWGYQRDMVQFLTQPQTGSADAWKRRLAAMRLQKIESNPLTADEVAMFEMFEREGWMPEQRRTHILSLARPLAAE